MGTVRRFWPIALLLAAILAAWAAGATRQISWESLGRNEAVLLAWVASHPIMAPSLYILIYAGAVLLSLPESAVLTAAAGLLFGTLFGGILAATILTLIFVPVFYAIIEQLRERRPVEAPSTAAYHAGAKPEPAE